MKHTRLVVFIVYIMGILSISLLSTYRYFEQAKASQSEMSLQVNKALTSLVQYYESSILPNIPNTDCADFLQKHNKIVFYEPYIRSISINESGIIMCSSVSKDLKIPVRSWKPENKKIRLFFTQNSPFQSKMFASESGILILKLSFDSDYSINFALYPELFNQLLNSYSKFGLTMQVENAQLDGAHSQLISEPNLQSSLFSVSYNSSSAYIVDYILKNSGVFLLLWSLILFFTRHSLYRLFETLTLEYWRINRGLKQQQFEPYFQPTFDMAGNCTGAEVLARWIDANGKVIPPYQFIDVAEKNGQINQITQQLMNKCAVYLENVHIKDGQQFNLGFNVCADQFDSDDFYQDIMKLKGQLSETGVDLIIELTERQAFVSQDSFANANLKFKQSGIRVALDDFGTGYCSLHYLLNSEIDIIKIDRSYIRTIDEGPNTNVLDSIIELANRTDSILLAEGVETTEQLAYLQSRGVKRYQGFLFDKPLPIQNLMTKYLC